MQLIEISKAQAGTMPISKHTAYKWRSLGKYPKLVIKVGGKVFFDVEEWERMARSAAR